MATAVEARVIRTALIKLVLAVASAIALQKFYDSWIMAVLLMVHIFVHEQGHLWAMRQYGLKTKGFYFIPVLGGVAIAEKGDKESQAQDFVISMMGPVWGLGLTLASLAGYFVFSAYPALAWLALASAAIGAVINLLNLLPLPLLDGGYAFRSIVYSFNKENWVAPTVLVAGALSIKVVHLATPRFTPVAAVIIVLALSRVLRKALRRIILTQAKLDALDSNYADWKDSPLGLAHPMVREYHEELQPILNEYLKPEPMRHRALAAASVAYPAVAVMLAVSLVACKNIILPFFEPPPPRQTGITYYGFPGKEPRYEPYRTIMGGDTLSKLADCYYGWDHLWPILAAANNIEDPDKIYAYDSIYIPNVDPRKMGTCKDGSSAWEMLG